jgi:hypothetical protein
MRRTDFGVSTVLASLAVLLAAASARATDPPVDATSCRIDCGSFYGTIGFSPGEVAGGTRPAGITVKGAVGACTVRSGCPGVTVVSGKVDGTLHSTGFGGWQTNDCATLDGETAALPLTGALTIKWKTSADSAPLLNAISTYTPGAIQGGLLRLDIDSVSAPQVTLTSDVGDTPSGVTGSFQGGDNGLGSHLFLMVNEDLNGVIGPACSGSPGLKLLHIGLGHLRLG